MLQTNRPVMDEILTRLPSTVILAVVAMGFAIILGEQPRCRSGLRRNTLVDTLAMLVALFGVSVPVFWLYSSDHALLRPPPVAPGHSGPADCSARGVAGPLSAATLARLVQSGSSACSSSVPRDRAGEGLTGRVMCVTPCPMQ